MPEIQIIMAAFIIHLLSSKFTLLDFAQVEYQKNQRETRRALEKRTAELTTAFNFFPA